MIISLIAAVDEQFGLGKDNALLCHLPADLQHFKSLTLGKPIIMGRKTFDSIGKALPGRQNIVLSHRPLIIDNIIVEASLEAALESTKDQAEVMIIGGANVYEQAMAFAQRIYLTVIHHQFDADVHFPEMNQQEWVCTSEAKHQKDDRHLYDMTFYEYQRIGAARNFLRNAYKTT